MDSPTHVKHATAKPSRRPAVDVAAQSASTSYREALPPEVLRDALRTGSVPDKFKAHIGTLLEEVPLSMLAKVVEQIHTEDAVPVDHVWSTMRALAHQLKVIRDEWVCEEEGPAR